MSKVSKKQLLSPIIGGAAGYVYYYFISCNTGGG